MLLGTKNHNYSRVNGTFFYGVDTFGRRTLNSDETKCIIDCRHLDNSEEDRHLFQKIESHLTLQDTIRKIVHKGKVIESPNHCTDIYQYTENDTNTMVTLEVHIYLDARANLDNTITTCKNITKKGEVFYVEDQTLINFFQGQARKEIFYLQELIAQKEAIVSDALKEIRKFKERAFHNLSLEEKLENAANHLAFLKKNTYYRYTDHYVKHSVDPAIAELELEIESLQHALLPTQEEKTATTSNAPPAILTVIQPKKPQPLAKKQFQQTLRSVEQSFNKLYNDCFSNLGINNIKKMVAFYQKIENNKFKKTMPSYFKELFECALEKNNEAVIRAIYEAFTEEEINFFELCQVHLKKKQIKRLDYLYNHYLPYKNGVDFKALVDECIQNSNHLDEKLSQLKSDYKKGSLPAGQENIKSLLEHYLCESFNLEGVQKVLEAFSEIIDFSTCYFIFLEKICMENVDNIEQNEKKIVALLQYLDKHSRDYYSVLINQGVAYKKTVEGKEFELGLLAGTMLNNRTLILEALIKQGFPKNRAQVFYPKLKVSLDINELIYVEAHYYFNRKKTPAPTLTDVFTMEAIGMSTHYLEVISGVVASSNRIPEASVYSDAVFKTLKKIISLSNEEIGFMALQLSDKINAIVYGCTLDRAIKQYNEGSANYKKVIQTYEKALLKKLNNASSPYSVSQLVIPIGLCGIALILAALHKDKIIPFAFIVTCLKAYENRSKIIPYLPSVLIERDSPLNVTRRDVEQKKNIQNTLPVYSNKGI